MHKADSTSDPIIYERDPLFYRLFSCANISEAFLEMLARHRNVRSALCRQRVAV
jgi:hypothetical protein